MNQRPSQPGSPRADLEATRENHASLELPPSEAYPADLYEAVHAGQPGDVNFYLGACHGAAKVLELGCGFGRVLSPLCRAGHEVWGLDNDEALLARAAERAPQAHLILGDMRTFELDERFDRVIIPFSGLWCLLDPADIVATLGRARAHLAPGGMVIFDGYAADGFHESAAEPGTDEPGLVKSVEVGGTRYDVFEHSHWVPAEQRIDAVYDHVPTDGGPAITATIPQRYLLVDEVPGLLAAAGLAPLIIHGDFDQHVYDPEISPKLIGTAVAPGGIDA